MNKIIEIIQIPRKNTSLPLLVDAEQYLITGDKKALKRVASSPRWNAIWFYNTEALQNQLGFSESMDEIQLRLLDLLIVRDCWEKPVLSAFRLEKENENLFPIFHDACVRCKKTESEIAQFFWETFPLRNSMGKLNSGARYYTNLSEQKLIECLALVSSSQEEDYNSYCFQYMFINLTKYLIECAPDKIEPLIPYLVLVDTARLPSSYKFRGQCFVDKTALLLMEKYGTKYDKIIFETWNQLENFQTKFYSGTLLLEVRPKLFLDPTKAAAENFLNHIKTPADAVQTWCLKFLIKYFDDKYAHLIHSGLLNLYYERQSELLAAIQANPKLKIEPYLHICLKSSELRIRMEALCFMIDAKDPKFDAAIENQFLKEFSDKNTLPQSMIKIIVQSRKWDPNKLMESYWTFLSNKSKIIRDTASRIIGVLENIDLERVQKLLAEKKADTRDSAVNILAQQGNDDAIKLLEARVDKETDENVRDKILWALESVWEKRGIKISMKTINERIERSAGKVAKFDCKWLDVKNLPPLTVEKHKLDEQSVRYLLYRQTRSKGMWADIEAKPLFQKIDRSTSGDFALAVLNTFLATEKQEASDRWALAIAGLLGDNRIVPILSKQVQKWADASRGKMSEYAVEALALLGTETALTVVNSMMIRYRSKNKNIGTAATNAFENVANIRGVTVDELGDQVVPWLGFEPGKPILWNIGGKDFEARIGMDFKVGLFDLEKKKTVASLPKSAPKEIAEEFKELKESLREVVKGQLVRIENMLVKQYRWPVDRWSKLYLLHPILRPFTVRLVWGYYDAKGKLTQTFRSLEDGSLTDVNDDAVKLPASGTVGIIHPLELSEEVRDQWRQHFSDYSVVAPFPQMERSVITPTDEEKKLLATGKWSGSELNAMTFKNRAEKLGWRRGSVCDAGMVGCYWKDFAETGVDVFLAVNDMYVGIGMDETISLSHLYFVKHGSVKIGSYVYDEPSVENCDERLIPFEKVPQIAFSEAFGDMGKIAFIKE